METKTIKISEENYRWLARLAAKLQQEQGNPVSFNEAINELKSKKKRSLLDLAGSWKMSDEEAERFEKESRALWKTWKLQSV